MRNARGKGGALCISIAASAVAVAVSAASSFALALGVVDSGVCDEGRETEPRGVTEGEELEFSEAAARLWMTLAVDADVSESCCCAFGE